MFLTLSVNVMNIDLLNPASFISGHPRERYDRLRHDEPVYRHGESAGPGFWGITAERGTK
ncbi:MAG: hypothetical protein VB957_16450 [Pseudomonadales bacterium]